ncbi:hypothetical protein NC653_033778 [Populus alba x Populus x berolinensis]|uniref:Uncharacterized protein n=1 Tax=Populus alba x Populus x berolinensis TaxID=444605 RepID=A0AAD6Q0R7_9ROSI|nr:hypothetical protein NC653_033778 [Populus alba x Populus x berolinensis]
MLVKKCCLKEVVQCCGSCGYPLNLTSSNRITSNIGSGYQKSIKKGYISFVSVDLSRFTQVDEVLPTSLAANPLQHLQYLSSSGCSEMPDSCLSFLQSYALKFLSLNLDCCFGITDNGLSLVAASCSSLEHVNLSYCPLVSDSGRARIQSCCQLEAVNVSHCRGVNGSGLGGFSPTSTHIDADSCKLEPEGIIGIVSGGGGGVEHLNVSRLMEMKSIAALAMGCLLLEE